MGGTAIIASAPALALTDDQSFGRPDFDDQTGTPVQTEMSFNTKVELSIDLSVDPIPVIRLTNNSTKQIVVQHIHPSIVHAGSSAFDLNSIFSDGAHTIEAGTSHDFSIKPISNTQPETPFPRHSFRNQPQRVVAVKGTDRHGKIVNSSRSFYA